MNDRQVEARQKLKHLLNGTDDQMEKAYEIMCALQWEYVSRRLLHEVWPTTDEIFFGGYVLSAMKVFSAVPREILMRGGNFLDVGCGEGRMALLLREVGLNCFGVDKYVFQGCNLEGEALGPRLKGLFRQRNVQVVSLDLETDSLPYSASFFDLVVCQEVIEHLYNSPKLMLDEIRRVMKPDGYFVISVPNIAALNRRRALLRGDTVHWNLERFYNYEFTASATSKEFIGHIREYTLTELEQMLGWADFEVVRSETYDLDPPLRAHDLLTYWRTGQGTGVWMMVSRLLQRICGDLGVFCLAVARPRLQ